MLKPISNQKFQNSKSFYSGKHSHTASLKHIALKNSELLSQFARVKHEDLKPISQFPQAEDSLYEEIEKSKREGPALMHTQNPSLSNVQSLG